MAQAVYTLVWYGLGECGTSAQDEGGTGLPELIRGWDMAGVKVSVCEALASIQGKVVRGLQTKAVWPFPRSKVGVLWEI